MMKTCRVKIRPLVINIAREHIVTKMSLLSYSIKLLWSQLVLKILSLSCFWATRLFFFLYLTRVFSFLYSTQRLQQAKDAPLGSRETTVLLVRSHNFFFSFSTHVQALQVPRLPRRRDLNFIVFVMSGRRTWIRKRKDITKNHGRHTLRLSTRRLTEQQNESPLLTLVLVIAVFE